MPFLDSFERPLSVSGSRSLTGVLLPWNACPTGPLSPRRPSESFRILDSYPQGTVQGKGFPWA